MRFKSSVNFIVWAIGRSLSELDEGGIERSILKAERVMIYGVGRSGLVARSFATRLMHLGIETYMMGETISPPIGEKDVVILISGSGRTDSVLRVGELAKEIGASVVAITSKEDSPLHRMADLGLVLRTDIDRTLAPLGTIFEDSAQIFLDGLVAELMEDLGESERSMSARHATLE